jgi:hypothetical protein
MNLRRAAPSEAFMRLALLSIAFVLAISSLGVSEARAQSLDCQSVRRTRVLARAAGLDAPKCRRASSMASATSSTVIFRGTPRSERALGCTVVMPSFLYLEYQV